MKKSLVLKITLIAIGLLVLMPLMPILTSWFSIEPDLWQHLWQTQLFELLKNTLFLSVLVGAGSFVLGVSLAWLLVFYEFPGRKVLQWGLMLPLAIPPYILAFAVLGFSDFGGPLQALLETLGFSASHLPDMRNLFGVALVFILCLYPYVYLLMRTALLRQGRANYESAQTLGYSKFAAFWKLVIPMTRPAWIAGLALVLMETLADFGAVSIFNFDTFTTAIYKSWFGMFSLSTAAQLASILLLMVFLAVYAEKWGRGQSQYVQSGSRMTLYRKRLQGFKGIMIQTGAWLVFALGFVLPAIQLLVWVFNYDGFAQSIVDLLTNSIFLAMIATFVTLIFALVLVFTLRTLQKAQLNKASQTWSLIGEFSLMGYALPGTLLAVGIMLSFNQLDSLISWIAGSPQQWFAASLFGLIFAYLVRFLRIAHGPVASSMSQIRPSLVEAAMSLGASQRERFFKVYIPLLRPGVLTALLLVFVEVMKEMPATLLLRPFGWDTLSVRIYELTSEGEWQLAALPALLLVAVGILPVIYLIKKSEQ